MSIYVGDKKALFLKSDNSVVEFYKGDKKLFGYDGKAEGSPLAITDLHPAEHNVGVKVASKNLLNPSYLEKVGWGYNLYGVGTSVSESDKIINFSATSESTSRRIQVLLPIEEFVLGETYTFTVNSSPTPTSIAVGYANNHNDTATFATFGKTERKNNCTFTVSNVDKPYVNIFIYFGSMAVGDTGTMTDLQIELGTTATEYTPYISNFAECENKIPYPYTDTTQTIGGITFTDNGDGSITVNGTAEWEEGVYFTVCTSILPSSITAGEYILSGNPSSDCELVVFDFKDDGSLISIIQNNGTPTTFRLTDNAMITVVFRVNEGKSVNNVTITPQIVRKDAIKVEVRKCGANLFPFAESVTIQGWYYNAAHSDFLPPQTDVAFLRGKVIRYSVYFDLSGAVEDTTRAGVKIIYYDANGTIIRQDFGNEIKKTDSVPKGYSTVVPPVPQNTVKIAFCITVFFNSTAKPDDNSFVTVSQGMVTLGNTAREYEPYTETIYTANADGTVEGVKSISPNMTLIPNSNAVTVECEYCKA